MADSKISALTSASTPLAGTEVLPIVQSSATVKVATNDLTVRNIRANATTGILQVTGPTAASTRVVTVPDANFTAARTDAAQSFTGDQTLSTGNLVIGTAGKGIDFSATSHPAGMTSELFDDYEEGTWTPVYSPTTNSFTSITAVTSGTYRKIGDVVYFWCDLRTTGTTIIGLASGTLNITGLPFTASGTGYGQVSSMQNWNLGTARTSVSVIVEGGGSLFYFGKINSNSGITYIQATELSIATGNFENLLGVFGMYQT